MEHWTKMERGRTYLYFVKSPEVLRDRQIGFGVN